MSDKSKHKPPYFITLEGGEGAGKSTQIKLLADKLRQQNIDVVQTREPGGCPQAETIRDLVVKGSKDRWDPYTEILLLYAARREHMVRTIWPALEKGQWVISDRFADSSMAYQGYGYGLGREPVEQVHKAVMNNFAPDLTIILDIDPKISLQRSQGHHKGENRYETMDMKFHEALRDGFLDIARREPERCVVIDANGSLESVQNAIWQCVSDRLLST